MTQFIHMHVIHDMCNMTSQTWSLSTSFVLIQADSQSAERCYRESNGHYITVWMAVCHSLKHASSTLTRLHEEPETSATGNDHPDHSIHSTLSTSWNDRSRTAGRRGLFLTGRKTGGLTPVRREHPIGLTARPAGR